MAIAGVAVDDESYVRAFQEAQHSDTLGVARQSQSSIDDFVQQEVPITEDIEKTRRVRWYAVQVCSHVALTGLFHGYDNGVVSDLFTMPSFRAMMGWPEEDDSRVAFEQGLTVNSFNIGCAVSAIVFGHILVDGYGRRPALITGSVLFTFGGALQTCANGLGVLIAGRCVAGAGVGLTSVTTPVYISEIAPETIRGAMVGMYQSNICLGIVIACLFNYWVHDAYDGWRYCLGLPLFFMGGGMAVGLLFRNETPPFLESVGRSVEALLCMTPLQDGDEQLARQKLERVRASIEEYQGQGRSSWREVFVNPLFRNVAIIGFLTQFLQIITGINAMVSYGGTIFRNLGVRGVAPALTPGLAFFLGNAVGAFLLVDRLGRRCLLIWGMVAMASALTVGGMAATVEGARLRQGELSESSGHLIIVMVVSYMFAFGISWGFGAWLYCSEIMPLRIRGKAVGLSSGANWGPANVISAFMTPQLVSSPIGSGGTLLVFASLCWITVPFAATCIPETSCKTLEDITPLFRFDSWAGFRRFVRGNTHGGLGCSMEGDQDMTKDAHEAPAASE